MKDYLKKKNPKLYNFLQNEISNVRYLKNIIFYKEKLSKFHYSIMKDDELINKIIKEKKSIARYGDGEFKWALGIKQDSFQNDDKRLQNRLLEILQSPSQQILIGIPISFATMKEYNYKARRYWVNFIVKHGEEVQSILSKNNIYANASITRPYIDYKKKSNAKKRFQNLKKVWNQREVIMIEGKMTKLGVGNDLFDNCKEIKRILCPSKNAFDKYDEILEAAKKIDKDKLILISLGPTATVLAYDLCMLGYQALDIGHIDIEYSWYLSGAKDKISVPGKYVNETEEKITSDIYHNNQKYLESIINEID